MQVISHRVNGSADIYSNTYATRVRGSCLRGEDSAPNLLVKALDLMNSRR